MGSYRLLLLLLLVTLVLMVTAQGPGGTSGRRAQRPLQSQILGVRRIRFTRRPPPSNTTPNTPVGAGVDSPVRAAAPGDDAAVTDDPTRAGSADADAEVDVDGGGPELGTTQEQLDRHWTYRRMLLQRERERLLHHLPAAVDTIPFPGAPEVTRNDDDEAVRSNDTDRNRNCTEYTVTEGTVRLCDEVHLMNSTDPASTTTGSVMSAAEAEMEARRAAMESQPIGVMSGQDWIERERYKQARLFMIQAMILQKLGLRRQPHVEDLDLSDNQRSQIMSAFRMYESEIGGGHLEDEGSYIRSLGLLTPSCDLPRNTNRVWRDGSRFRLYFQIQPPAWTETKINSASLRIYKRAMQDCEDCYYRSREIPEPLVERQGRRRRHRRTQDMPDFRSMIQPLDVTIGPEVLPLGEDTVQVVVYSYTKSVKNRRKEKVQELVSVVVRRDYEGWLKLDIKRAVTDWYSATPQKNFGLLVRVLDHHGRELYPFSILTPANCTLNSNFTLPYPLSVGDGNDSYNGTDVNGNQTTPYLDLVTLGTSRYNAVIRRRRSAAVAGAFSTKKHTSRSRAQQPFQRANLSTLLQWLSEKIMQSKLRIALHRSKRSYSQ